MTHTHTHLSLSAPAIPRSLGSVETFHVQDYLLCFEPLLPLQFLLLVTNQITIDLIIEASGVEH